MKCGRLTKVLAERIPKTERKLQPAGLMGCTERSCQSFMINIKELHQAQSKILLVPHAKTNGPHDYRERCWMARRLS